MKLGEYIAKLQAIANDDPKLLNYAIKFRSLNAQESFVYFHTEGRTLVFSEKWVNEHMIPGKPGYDKLVKKVKTIEEIKDQDEMEMVLRDIKRIRNSLVPPEGHVILSSGSTELGDLIWNPSKNEWVKIIKQADLNKAVSFFYGVARRV